MGAMQPGAVVDVGGAQAAFGHQSVALVVAQGGEGECLRVERWQVAGLAQQQQLESAQRGSSQWLGLVRGQHMHQRRVGVEQARVGVFTRQQAHEQFVGVIAGEQRIARGHHLAAAPLGAFQRANLRIAAPAQRKLLQRQ